MGGRKEGVNDSSESQILKIFGLFLLPASRCALSIDFSVIYSVLFYSIVCSALLYCAPSHELHCIVLRLLASSCTGPTASCCKR